MCLALCWKSGCLEGRWTRLVVCQEIKWTACPWLHLYTCFYFLNVSAERIEQCVRWTRDIHETNKQTKRRREQHQLSHDFLILKCHSYFGQFFCCGTQTWSVRHSASFLGVCLCVKCGWMCTRTDRAWAWRRARVHGGWRGTCVRMFMYCVTTVV